MGPSQAYAIVRVDKDRYRLDRLDGMTGSTSDAVVAAFGPAKPLAGTWFGKRVHGPLRRDAREAAADAEADQLGTRGLLRLVRQLETVQRQRQSALLHLTEGQSQAAWRVLTGREEP